MSYGPPGTFDWDEHAREFYWTSISSEGEQEFGDLDPKRWGWALLDLNARLEEIESRTPDERWWRLREAIADKMAGQPPAQFETFNWVLKKMVELEGK